MTNKGIKIALCVFMISLLLNISNIYAISITSPSKVAVGKNITITLNFGTSIGAYDSIKVDYDTNLLEYVSGDEIEESVWWDNSPESRGITSKTYTFKAKDDGLATVKISVKGLTSANQTMDYIGDVNVSRDIILGSGILKGDADKNGVVDANDAYLILEIYKSENATKEQTTICDLDRNGIIDANDASLILEQFKIRK